MFRKFLKQGTGSLDEKGISSLSRLDAFITDAIDSLSQTIEDTSKIVLQRDETVKPDFPDVSEKDLTSIKQVGAKGKISPHDSTERLKILLPFSSSQVLSCCREVFS